MKKIAWGGEALGDLFVWALTPYHGRKRGPRIPRSPFLLPEFRLYFVFLISIHMAS